MERVYYRHRLGEKPPFEQALPPATLENLIRQDLRREAVLKKVYDVQVSAAQLDAEVQRINNTTRAPEMLAEIKAALGNDPARFARAIVRPILIERLLREKFDNDDKLHAAQRRQVEQTRHELPAAKQNVADAETLLVLLQRSHSNAVTETTWQLGSRPAETNAPNADLLEVQERFGPKAQLLSSPQAGDGKERLYFEDLPGELQNVLRIQLRQAGDISAVIEMPEHFALYVAKTKLATVMSVGRLSLPKRNYEQWLDERSAGRP